MRSSSYYAELEKIYHVTIRKVSKDFETLAFNTAISQMMIFVNEVYKVGSCPKEYAEGLIKMLSCICPHVGEEIWAKLGHDSTIAYENWPQYDEAKTVDDTVEIGVQIKGKVKAVVAIPRNADKETAFALAKADEKIAAEMEGGSIGHICTLNNTKFSVLRVISDNADGSADMSFDVFAKKASDNNVKLITIHDSKGLEFPYCFYIASLPL